MSTFEYNKSMLRYSIISVVMTVIAVSVLAKGFYIMTVQRSYWNEVNSLMKFDSIEVAPMRGNILSA
jgi:cell division protein FtsI (penicillin-binding protein 3)